MSHLKTTSSVAHVSCQNKPLYGTVCPYSVSLYRAYRKMGMHVLFLKERLCFSHLIIITLSGTAARQK